MELARRPGGFMRKSYPEWLRGVVFEGRLYVRRKYAQSTSGLMSSHRTTPRDSRSISIASDSRIGWPAEMAFRRYPTDVLQREANASCSERSSELRYERSDSMGVILPDGKISSIPDGKLLVGKDCYVPAMDISKVRTAKFLHYVRTRYNNSPGEVEKRTGYSANMVSQILGGSKQVRTEKLARKLEKLLRLPPNDLDQPIVADTQPASASAPSDSWPFSVPQGSFQSLTPKMQREIDEALTRMVIGAQAQNVMNKPKKSG